MQKICAWCKKELAGSDDRGADQEITHGICSSCALKASRTIPRNLKDLLDMISEPVLMVDSGGIVKAANKNGLKLLGKDLPAIENLPGGDVLECPNARLPEGCGHTLHCMTCAVRNIMMDTLAHGHSYIRVPAFQKIRTPEGEQIRRYTISTEKVGEFILLRIDEVAEKVTT